jgi:hypothetical protein
MLAAIAGPRKLDGLSGISLRICQIDMGGGKISAGAGGGAGGGYWKRRLMPGGVSLAVETPHSHMGG